MVEVSEKESEGRTRLFRPIGNGSIVLVGNDWRFFYECARCDAPLIAGFSVDGTPNTRNIVFRCGICGAYNKLPG
jgi:RNase P subunit RPR2